MSTNKQKTKEFYQYLGKLFYAIAMADNKIMPNEINSLRNNVKKNWLPIDDGEPLGRDLVSEIESVFDLLTQHGEKGDGYFEEFKGFYQANLALFSPQIKKRIWKTADDIAASHAHKNKSELILLNKLKLILS